MLERTRTNGGDQSERVAAVEQEKHPDAVLYLISDIHDLSQNKVSSLLDKIKSKAGEARGDKISVSFSFLMGDLPSSDVEDNLVREFKAAGGDPEKLTFKSGEERRIFDEGAKKRGTRAGVYRKARLSSPELLQQARVDAQEKNRQIADVFSKLPNPNVFFGNADVNAPYPSIEEEYTKEGVNHIEEPRMIDLGDKALIVWPSVSDPKAYTDEQLAEFDRHMSQKAQEFAAKCQDKTDVVVVTHEQLFFGSRKYRDRVKDIGQKPYGSPYKGRNPSRDYIVQFISLLPEKVKLGVAFGHLHSMPEVVAHGADLQLKKTVAGGLGEYHFGVKPPGGEEKVRRTAELFYVPQGQLGVLKIGKDGFRFQLEQ